MTALGFALLLLGAALVVAEAHVPGGVLGVLGGVALILGGVLVIDSAGGGAALALPVGIGLGLAAGAWALLVTRKAAQQRVMALQDLGKNIPRSLPEGGRTLDVRHQEGEGGRPAPARVPRCLQRGPRARRREPGAAAARRARAVRRGDRVPE